MKKLILALMLMIVACVPVQAETMPPFKKYNPDGMKYEFARSYIASLAYLNSVEQRWKKSDSIKKRSSQEKFIAWNIERLIYDNMDIRVAKNYMTKYFQDKNLLMRKVVDTYVYACDQLVDVNRQERESWESAKLLLESGEVDPSYEKKFVAEQERIAAQRKEAMKSVVTASVLMTKVILSEDAKEKDVTKRLAISTEQREKLIDKLDSYAKDNMDWSLKPGQTFVEAAEASVREVLEDPVYLSADE